MYQHLVCGKSPFRWRQHQIRSDPALNSDINSLYTLCIFIQNYRNNLLILYQNLNGYKFDVIDGIPSYKAGADAAWVPFSNPEVYFAQYSFPGDQSTIPFTLSKAQLWLLTNGNWFTQYQNQLKLQINGATVPVASYTKYNNCYIAKYDTKQYINSAASLLVNRSMVVANAYTYIMLIGV